MGPRLVRLAGAALTFLVAGGFVCRSTVSSPPPPYVVPPEETVPDAATETANERQSGPCGELGLRCCEGDQCNGRTACLGGICVPCGAPGTILCGTVPSCDEWAQPNDDSHLCQSCGSENQLCCSRSNSEDCRDGQIPPVGCYNDENVYRCLRCPADAGLCLAIRPRTDAGTSTGPMPCGPGLVRNRDGVCVACGLRGGPCCRNSACAFPFTCSAGGTCEGGRCGRLTQPCCRNNLCVVGHCSAGACRP